MKKKKKKLLALILVCILMMGTVACGSGNQPTDETSPAGNNGTAENDEATGNDEVAGNDAENSDSAATAEKKDIVLMIENTDEPAMVGVIEKIRQKFPQYNIISKQVDGATTEQTVKSTFATDSEALDLVMYMNSMSTFVESDMATDLLPYLEADPDFAASFNQGALYSGQQYIDGKLYALPYSIVYPMMEVNTEILAEAGVELKESWTWGEFLSACEQIAANTDAFPVGCRGDFSGWFGVQAFIQAFSDEAEYLEFCKGNIPFSDERIIANMDNVANLYNSDYVYPGAGAVSVTGEEVDAAFANGTIAMRCDVNSVSKGFIDSIGMDLTQISICSWPTMAEEGPGSVGDRVLGGNNIYFIPENSQNKDAAVEILKYIFSDEIQRDYAAAGTVICVNLAGNEDLAEFSKDASKIAVDLIYNHSAELATYITFELMSGYINDKEEAIGRFIELQSAMTQ